MISRIRNAVLWLMNWRTWRFRIMFVICCPTAYFLSIGPLHWLDVNDYIQVDSPLGRFLQLVYTPVTFLMERFEPFAQIVVWYASLWYPVG